MCPTLDEENKVSNCQKGDLALGSSLAVCPAPAVSPDSCTGDAGTSWMCYGLRGAEQRFWVPILAPPPPSRVSPSALPNLWASVSHLQSGCSEAARWVASGWPRSHTGKVAWCRLPCCPPCTCVMAPPAAGHTSQTRLHADVPGQKGQPVTCTAQKSLLMTTLVCSQSLRRNLSGQA